MNQNHIVLQSMDPVTPFQNYERLNRSKKHPINCIKLASNQSAFENSHIRILKTQNLNSTRRIIEWS